MATISLRTDDITGETLPEDTPTTRIFLEDERGDVSIEIDLSDTNFKALQKALSKYVDKARPVPALLPPEKTKGTSEAAAARAWALANRPDLKVSERGAVAKAVLEAYREHLAHSAETNTDAPTPE